MFNNANMLTAKAPPELLRRARKAAAVSNINLSSLIRHAVIRLCSEIERDGFLTIQMQPKQAPRTRRKKPAA